MEKYRWSLISLKCGINYLVFEITCGISIAVVACGGVLMAEFMPTPFEKYRGALTREPSIRSIKSLILLISIFTALAAIVAIILVLAKIDQTFLGTVVVHGITMMNVFIFNFLFDDKPPKNPKKWGVSELGKKLAKLVEIQHRNPDPVAV